MLGVVQFGEFFGQPFGENTFSKSVPQTTENWNSQRDRISDFWLQVHENLPAALQSLVQVSLRKPPKRIKIRGHRDSVPTTSAIKNFRNCLFRAQKQPSKVKTEARYGRIRSRFLYQESHVEGNSWPWRKLSPHATKLRTSSRVPTRVITDTG